ncbi:MAG: metallophosphoesterase, partial [Kiritimatiellae bacterium]|nr:metallophosphoesterase [Kiritimatiellia bacterium]
MRATLFSMATIASMAAAVAVAEGLPPLPDGAFTYVVIPDTQCYHGAGSKVRPGEEPQTGPTTNPAFESRVDWIAANVVKERIAFVSHVGDITDIHSEEQWAFSSNLMARLDGVVPYGISPGNHDLEVSTSEGFNRYFPRKRYEGNTWYVGAFDGYTRADGQFVSGGNANSCQVFDAGGAKFVVLHLECNAPAPVLAWADEMLERFSDRHAIICTHMYQGLRTRAFFAARKGTHDRPDEWFGVLEWTKCHGKEGVPATKAWEKCFSRHANVFLIVSGDQGPAICWRETQTGVSGNIVHAVMQDYPR